ncbi:MAG: MoxR family ATPase [Microthrixaceae bacterium]|nr:MoxR family ATPase [Microthrixaceae bacterium]
MTEPTQSPFDALVKQVSGVVLGDPEPIRLAATAFLAGGHVLFEDIPGVGKTLLAKALAASIGGSFGRVQGTPDLLPSDLTGVSIYDDRDRTWSFQPGPLFHNVVLVDELNRATPRTQSALLEAMAEGQVTVDGTTHLLPRPFFVLATQNPHGGDLGTFPLVAGQRDRFALSLSMGLPGRQAESAIIEGRGGDRSLDALQPVADLDHWVAHHAQLDDVYLHPAVATYLLDVIDMVRTRSGSSTPLSTRASLTMVRLARSRALAAGRTFVEPDDIQALAVSVLAHRILDVTNDDLATARVWISNFVAQVPAPPVQA